MTNERRICSVKDCPNEATVAYHFRREVVAKPGTSVIVPYFCPGHLEEMQTHQLYEPFDYLRVSIHLAPASN